MDVTVCYCFHVSRQRIRDAIRQYGLTSVEEVIRRTHACLGCRTCRPDIEDILTEEAARRRDADSSPGPLWPS